MPTYKLNYFGVRGRGEVIRMVFAVAGVSYEDNRLNASDWAEAKSGTVCGQIPELEIDGFRLPETRAICRYLAREFGLFGYGNLEMAKIEAVCCILEDLVERIILVGMERDQATQTKLRQQFQTESGKFAEKLENILEHFNSNGDFFVGNKITLADIVFFNAYHDCVHLGSGCERAACLSGHPSLKKIYQNCLANEKIQAWLKERPVTDH